MTSSFAYRPERRVVHRQNNIRLLAPPHIATYLPELCRARGALPVIFRAEDAAEHARQLAFAVKVQERLREFGRTRLRGGQQGSSW